MTDLVLEFFDFCTVEFHNFFAVLADDVVMVGMIRIVRIIKFVILAEIHFVNQTAFREERKGAVNGGA